MNRTTSLTSTLLLLALACSAPQDSATPGAAKAPPSAERAAPIVAPTPRLARRALELQQRGKALEALELLLTELPQRLRSAPWEDEALTLDSIVAAQALERGLESIAAWGLAVEKLEAAKPFAPTTPPELAAQLDLVLARGLARVGRVAEARKLTLAGGALVDWQIIGPFANERGGGFDTAYDPESNLDFAATMRGKERDVAWRANPTPDQVLANLVLADMLRPNEQAVAYLATALHVDQPREVVLALGTSGAVKVWHGDTLVHSNKVHRPCRRDQDRVVLALHEGWNRVLVKVGVEERLGWMVTARLIDLDGRPFAGWRQDSLQAPAARAEVAAASAKASPSVRERLEALAAKDDAPQTRAEALRLLALHHLHLHPDDTAAQSAKKHAEAALALEPDDVFTLYLVARANEPEPGATISEIRHNERLAPLKRVLALEPTHAGALLDLAQFHSGLNPIPRLAEEYSRRALEAAPESYAAQVQRVEVLQEAGRGAEATQLAERARDSREGRLRPDAVVSAAAWEGWRGAVAAERARLEKALQSGVSERPVFDALVRLHTRQGDSAEVVRAANTWLERASNDVEFMLGVARSLEFAGAVREAKELVERARNVCPEHPTAARALARLAQRENDLEAADRWLAEVLRLDPGYDKARRQREVLLEQGQERFESPYRWDAVERIGAATPNVDANEKVQIVDRTTVWRVNEDGSEHMYEHVLLQVANSGGVKDLDNYWIVYPDDSTLQVYNVRVVHADGSFERAPPPSGRDRGFDARFGRFFDLPALEVGDFVDVEYRIDQRQADVFGQYFGTRHSFYVDYPDSLAPVARAELIVLAPKDVAIYSKAHNGDALEHEVGDTAEGLSAHRWVARDLKRPTPQTAMPDRIEFAPTVDVSTFESWEAFASWWWSFIEKEFVTTQAMKDKVSELTAGLDDELAKIRAIARFVGQEIRYNAWSFGTHGYEPFSAATIFERRFGDCKDKSILLRQMLAEIGVESHPVLINAEYRRPEEKLDVAMVGHFNHCIAYVPATDTRAGFYLDATADRNPIEYLRADDQGAKVLHVDEDKGAIERIDYSAARENAVRREYEVELDDQGHGAVRLVDESVGAFGVQLRHQFGGEKGDLNKRTADALAQAFGKVDIREVSTSKLEDIGAPARLETSFQATNLWARDGGGANLRLGFDDIPLLDVAREPSAEREWEIVLDRPMELSTSVAYRLPEGAQITTLPPDAQIVADGLVEYSLTTRRTPEGVVVERRFTLLERRIPTARYAEFQDALREIRSAEDRTVGLRTGPVEASSKENK
jgi:tetratricopeptide (TPR) repeat protein